MTNTDFSEQWKSMQSMFLPTSALSESFRENARRFWESQDKILDNMQAFTNSWFDHRHTGTHSAQDRTETMADLIQAYQDWAKGAFERIMADGLSCQRQIIATTGDITSSAIAPSVAERVGDHTRP